MPQSIDLGRSLPQVGPRPAGSEGAATGRGLIRERFEALGAKVSEQEFHFVSHSPAGAELRLDGQSWEAQPALHSASTPSGGAEGTVVFLGTQVAIPGILEGEAFGIVDDGVEVGRILVNPYGDAATFPTGYGPTLTQVSAWVGHGDEERLRQKIGTRATLEVTGSFAPAVEANVLGRLAGKSARQVLVTAHHDTVWNGPGAIDNSTGVEGVAQVLERCGPRVGEIGLTGIAFGGEEVGLLGSRFALTEAKLRGELADVVAVVNMDSLGRGPQLLVQTTAGRLREATARALAANPLPARVRIVGQDPGPGSDHFPFAQEGVPVLALVQFPYAEYHRPEETPEMVDAETFDAIVATATAVVDDLLSGEEAPVDG
jgi:hypothetical protein